MSTKNSTLMSHAIAFYNTENLFDFFDNEKINDSDFTPRADKRWTKKRYQEKLNKIGYTISNIGETETQKHPALIGLAEVENKYVLNDLIASKHLKDCHYK